MKNSFRVTSDNPIKLIFFWCICGMIILKSQKFLFFIIMLLHHQNFQLESHLKNFTKLVSDNEQRGRGAWVRT